jgi:hypothetical protein
MRKGILNILWVAFLLILPSIYILLKRIFPNDLKIEIIIVYAPYLLSIITIMIRLDIRAYFIYKRFFLFLFGSDTAWLFNVRYTNIHSQYQVLITLEQALIQQGCKIIQSNNTFLNVLYDNTNMLNFRLENPASQNFDLHFYTSKIEVPYKSIDKKIKTLSKVTEIIENILDMSDRNSKQYEIQRLLQN